MAWRKDQAERRREWTNEYRRKKRLENPKQPRQPKPLEERMIMVYGTVKKKHWKEAQELITEILKQFR